MVKTAGLRKLGKRKVDVDSSTNVNIPYKDTMEVKQQLLLIAAKQGHGKVIWVVREAVKEYLRSQGKAA